MHEAEIGQHRAGKGEGRSLHEIAFNDEHADRAEHEAGKDRAAAHYLQPMVDHALLRQRSDGRGLDVAHLVGRKPAHRLGCIEGRPEHGVDLQLGPGGEMRGQRQHDRRRMLDRRGLERLRADQHADVEQDRRDRDHRHQRQ